MEKQMFGPHLMIDLWDCNKDKLSNYNLVFQMLYELPNQIGMTKITQPYVFPYEGLVPEDKGITGVTIIAESHITIHTFQEKGFAFVDVFTCKPFKSETDKETIINYFKNHFEAKRYEIYLANRGKEFKR